MFSFLNIEAPGKILQFSGTVERHKWESRIVLVNRDLKDPVNLRHAWPANLDIKFLRIEPNAGGS